MNERVLIVDDDRTIQELVRMHLSVEGFTVDTAGSGQEALDLAKATPPDIIVLDFMMPEMNGLEVLRQLRTMVETMNTSVILLTGKPLDAGQREALQLGADDYMTKPFDLDQLTARIRTVLLRSQAMRDVSPLTGLPGNARIAHELERRVENQEPFALVHADLDNFKAFNDHYGFLRGDGVIKYCAQALLFAGAQSGDPQTFVGHIGGDDFAAVLDPDYVEEFCKEAIRMFDDGILDLYDTADAIRGSIEVKDRRGQLHDFPTTSVSMGVATNQHRVITSAAEASTIATEMKEHAKDHPGSNYKIDRRSG